MSHKYYTGLGYNEVANCPTCLVTVYITKNMLLLGNSSKKFKSSKLISVSDAGYFCGYGMRGLISTV